MNMVFLKKRKVLYSIIVVLILAVGFTVNSWNSQKIQNRALRIKMLALNKERKTPKPWTALLGQGATPVQEQSVQVQMSAPVRAATSTAEVMSKNPSGLRSNLSDLSTQDLALELSSRMSDIKESDKDSIDVTLEIADEIILREPESYAAYKAKLIALLVKEGKFKEEADDSEIDGLLETMSGFETTRKETIVSGALDEQNDAEARVNELADEIEETYASLQSIDKNSPEFIELQHYQEQLAAEYQVTLKAMQDNEASIAQVMYGPDSANRDMVEIPFLRMMAKNDYEGVIENAQNFIEAFPASTDGYFYLYKAFQKQGQGEQAEAILRNTNLNTESQKALRQRLQASGEDSGQNYWQNLRF